MSGEPCICDTNPTTTDGPSEDCPEHGRAYSWWVDYAYKMRTTNDVLTEKIRSLNMSLNSVGEAVHAATGTPADGDHWELAMARLAEMGEQDSGDVSGIVLHRVIVSLILTDRPDDEAEIISVDFEGEPPMVIALGMLRMAEDTMLHGPDEEA